MNIGATNYKEAKENLFISNLYEYRKAITELEKLNKSKGISTTVAELNSHNEAAFVYFSRAINIAVRKAMEDGSTSKIEQSNFRQWLTSQEEWILGAIGHLSANFSVYENDEACELTVAECAKWIRSINELRIQARMDFSAEVSNPTFKINQNDLNSTFSSIKNKSSKLKAKIAGNYLNKFLRLLSDIESKRSRMIEYTLDPSNLNSHYNNLIELYNDTAFREELKKLRSKQIEVDPDKKKDILSEIENERKLTSRWKAFKKNCLSVKTDEDLAAWVEQSIEIIEIEENKTNLEKIKSLFKRLISDLKNIMQEAFEEVPSIKNRVAEWLKKAFGGALGIALSPITIPGLALASLVDSRAGQTLDWYIANTFYTKEAWIGLAILSMLAAGIVIPVVHPLLLSALAAAPTAVIAIGTGVTVGGFMYLRYQGEIKKIKDRYEREIISLKDLRNETVGAEEKEQKENKSYKKSAKRKESFRKFKSSMRAAAEEYNREEESSEEATNEANANTRAEAHEASIFDQISRFFSSMSREDAAEAYQTYRDSLAATQADLDKLNKRKEEVLSNCTALATQMEMEANLDEESAVINENEPSSPNPTPSSQETDHVRFFARPPEPTNESHAENTHSPENNLETEEGGEIESDQAWQSMTNKP